MHAWFKLINIYLFWFRNVEQDAQCSSPFTCSYVQLFLKLVFFYIFLTALLIYFKINQFLYLFITINISQIICHILHLQYSKSLQMLSCHKFVDPVSFYCHKQVGIFKVKDSIVLMTFSSAAIILS